MLEKRLKNNKKSVYELGKDFFVSIVLILRIIVSIDRFFKVLNQGLGLRGNKFYHHQVFKFFGYTKNNNTMYLP
ncbi:MAG: Unknown protein [uncultured Sulfurovum sp.]|uniref:Uncharacterized protein n=1 Tax=uncultured Sulfurovum sp. TaxID=269237 RepID=A0A6S6SEP5_9BACT|nr:MAG: Unknown protein [uncultured Sulfurovum sp.]